MKTILIVDDDQMMLDLYQTKFSRLGYQVVTVTEPGHFMEEVLSQKPALIMLDRRLGEADGLDLLKNLRRQEAGKNLPVLVLSNLEPSPEEFAEVKNLGQAEYLIKEHVDLNELAKKVASLVGPAA